ncbi:helix-turn-helix domain-containing protein [bacterium]|nr:helix-turn-helix domain-containing protein [bacterium]
MLSDRARKRYCRRVAELLREERSRGGLSMTDVAAKAGLSQQMVSYVERGLRTPSLDTLVRMADAVGCDLPDILTRARSEN